MRKDKKQVIGDEIGDEQIKLFLDFEPVDATSPSLHKLVKAYRGLRIDDFERFLTFFVEAGLDLNGKDEHGNDFCRPDQGSAQRSGLHRADRESARLIVAREQAPSLQR